MILKLTQREILEVLAGVPLFAELTRKDLRALSRTCSAARFQAGDEILRQNEVAQHMVVLVDGTASVRRDGKVLATLGPGDAAGEMALIDRRPRSASVVADGPVDVVLVYAREFERLVAEQPSICARLLRAQTSRLRALDRRATLLD